MKNLSCTLAIVMMAAFTTVCQETIFHQEVSWLVDDKLLRYTVLRKADPKSNQISSEIWMMKADGTGALKVADNAMWSSWTRDGKRLLFTQSSADRKSSDLYALNLDGSDLVQLTKDSKRNSAPKFSPDGKAIVFSSNRDGDKYQIYVMNAHGSGVRRLTANPAIGYYNPDWSPDGKRIVFYAEKGDQKDQIWIMNADGSNLKLITNNIGHNIYPAWSPDGKRIIFSSSKRETKPDGSFVEGSYIYTVKADGTDLKRLGNIKSFYARFSPNGKKLAYIVGSFPSTDIYISNADGSNAVKVTQ